MAAPPPRLVFMTVNDVYEMSPNADGLGGMAELATMIAAERAALRPTDRMLATLNGDFLSGSLLALRYQGMHMVDILNEFIDVVCVGNHELDAGRTAFENCLANSRFRWFGSNVIDVKTGACFPGVTDVHCEVVDGFKVGFFGVCTTEVPQLSYPGPTIRFDDYLDVAKRCVKTLQEQHKVDAIVAYTHLLSAEDELLAETCPEVNLILGGHDHWPYTRMVGDTLILKSGMDAQYVSRVDMELTRDPEDNQAQVLFSWKTTANRGFEPHAKVAGIIRGFTQKLEEEMVEELAEATTDLDSTTTHVRSRETTFGNALADLVAAEFDVPLVFLNGGTIRGNHHYKKHHRITRGDIMREFPFPNTLSVIKITGADLWQSLEEGVRKVESRTGYFPQVAGFSFTFDSSRKAFDRILSVTVGGHPISRYDTHVTHTLVVNEYLRKGGDGFSRMVGCEVVEHGKAEKLMFVIVLEALRRRKEFGGVLEERIVDISKIR